MSTKIKRETPTRPAPDIPAVLWEEDWRLPDWSYPVEYGVERAVTETVTYVRAWATAAGDEPKRFESEVYELVKGADVSFEGVSILATHRDRIVAEASTIRAHMRPDQASPADMKSLARSLQEVAKTYYEVTAEAAAKQRAQAIEDEKALHTFRYWLRGAQLILNGEDEDEKALLRAVFGGQ